MIGNKVIIIQIKTILAHLVLIPISYMCHSLAMCPSAKVQCRINLFRQCDVGAIKATKLLLNAGLLKPPLLLYHWRPWFTVQSCENLFNHTFWPDKLSETGGFIQDFSTVCQNVGMIPYKLADTALWPTHLKRQNKIELNLSAFVLEALLPSSCSNNLLNKDVD